MCKFVAVGLFVGLSLSVAFATRAHAEPLSCRDLVTKVAGAEEKRLQEFCLEPKQLNGCASTQNTAIQHLDAMANSAGGKRILVLALVHGDEPLSSRLALEWALRLKGISNRNSWRVVPFMNPDGLVAGTRTNSRNVDLNRNFPTLDWDAEASRYWTISQKKDPRRFPGVAAASEAETRCALAHITDFQPDFVVAIHTPYGVLDFDGPRTRFPRYDSLPWKALGNFPGSLGRLMWKDHRLPVLTVELNTKMVDPAPLQDIIGTFAMRALPSSLQPTKPQFTKWLTQTASTAQVKAN